MGRSKQPVSCTLLTPSNGGRRPREVAAMSTTNPTGPVINKTSEIKNKSTTVLTLFISTFSSFLLILFPKRIVNVNPISDAKKIENNMSEKTGEISFNDATIS